MKRAAATPADQEESARSKVVSGVAVGLGNNSSGSNRMLSSASSERSLTSQGSGADSDLLRLLALQQQQQQQQQQPPVFSSSLSALLAQQRLQQLQQHQGALSGGGISALALLQQQQQELMLAEHLQMQQQQNSARNHALLTALASQRGAGISPGGNPFDAHTVLLPGLSTSGPNTVASVSYPQEAKLSAKEDNLDGNASSSKVTAAEADQEINGGTAKKSDRQDSERKAEEEDNADADETNDTFPFKLFRMIAEAEKEGNDKIISFNEDGLCFIIHKPREFVSDIMPKYFTTSRMSSFQRQLNLYGFRRISEGKDKGGYAHEDFIKGRRSLCKRIKRKKPSVKWPPPGLGLGYMMNPSMLAGAINPAMSVRQLIADGQLTTEPGMAQLSQLQNPLAGIGTVAVGMGGGSTSAMAALLLEQQQRQQSDLLQQLILRQQQERELKFLEQQKSGTSGGKQQLPDRS